MFSSVNIDYQILTILRIDLNRKASTIFAIYVIIEVSSLILR